MRSAASRIRIVERHDALAVAAIMERIHRAPHTRYRGAVTTAIEKLLSELDVARVASPALRARTRALLLTPSVPSAATAEKECLDAYVLAVATGVAPAGLADLVQLTGCPEPSRRAARGHTSSCSRGTRAAGGFGGAARFDSPGRACSPLTASARKFPRVLATNAAQQHPAFGK